MKLLLITRKIDQDDGGTGFMHAWVKKFAQRVDGLIVICQEKGNIADLEGIRVYSLGKEKIGKYPRFIKRIIYTLKFYKYIWKFRNEYDAVFVHMHKVYIFLGFWIWKLLNKKIGLWYAHVKTTPTAKLSSYFINFVFSPSSHSFRYADHKLKQTGHGIDTDIFKPAHEEKNDKLQIISVGRISLIKEYEILIEAINILVHKHKFTNFEIKVAGQPANPEDHDYLKNLKEKINEYHLEEYFDWMGDVANKDVYRLYQKGDIFVSMQPGAGGGFAKATLEAMATELICVLNIQVYNEMLGEYKKETIYQPKNPNDMAEKLNLVVNWSEEKRKGYKNLVRNYVIKNHNLNNLIDKIVSIYK